MKPSLVYSSETTPKAARSRLGRKLAVVSEIIEFLGESASKLLILGSLTGISLVAIELCLGFGIQLILTKSSGAYAPKIGILAVLQGWSSSRLLLAFCVLGILRSAVLWFGSYFPAKLQSEFQLVQRSRLTRGVFANRSVSLAEMTSLFNERVVQASMVPKLVLEFTVYVVTALSFAIVLNHLSTRLFAITSVFLLFLVIPIRLTNKICRKAGKELFLDWQKVNARLLMGMRNLLFLRISGTVSSEIAVTTGSLNSHYAHSLAYAKANALESVSPQVVGILLICALAGYGNSQGIEAARLLTYVYILVRFLQVVSNMFSRISTITFLSPQFKHLYTWYQAHRDVTTVESVSEKTGNPMPELKSLIGWRVKDLGFVHSDTPRSLFNGLDFRISPETTTVLIGPSGSGKTTLLSLLIGDRTATTGSVEVEWNGKFYPLAEVRADLLKNLGYVGADNFFFEGTLYDNLIYGLKSTPSPKEVEEALELAECQFVDSFPKKIHHLLTDQGDGISTGQKQRLSLARALLRKPKALILDEVTSNLDRDTEKRLVATLARLSDRFTIIAVTHRAELLEIADQVIEMGESSETRIAPPTLASARNKKRR